MKIWKEKGKVIIKVKYDKEIVKKLNDIGGGFWDKNKKIWIFPLSKFDDLKALNEYKVKNQSYKRDERSKILKEYLIRKGYSPKTIKNYVNHFKNYLRFSENNIDIESINKYLLYLLESKNLSHSYTNQAVNAINLI
mgnify:CR=1 FL=1